MKTKLIEDGGIMAGKGDLGVKRNAPSQEIPKQSKAPTMTSNGKKNFDVAKKMKKIMKKVTGC